MTKGKFKIKGTKDFLIAAVFLGFLCIWSIRDAWFPTKKVLEKHPQEISVAFRVPGVIRDIPVEAGQEIKGETVLARLYSKSYQQALDEARAEFDAAREQSAPDVEQKLEALTRARRQMEACTLKNTDITWSGSHGEESLRGEILRIDAAPATEVEVLNASATGTVVSVSSDEILLAAGLDAPAENRRRVEVPAGLVPQVNKGDAIAAGDLLAGTPVVTVDPQDTFYLFNKTLSVLTFIGTVAALIMHAIASR